MCKNNPCDQRKITSKIQESDTGKRIDLWLSNRFSYQSRKQWQDAIKNKIILLNNKSCRPSAKLKLNDIIDFIPDIKEPPVDKSYSVIFEDEFLLAINKPALLPCHPSGIYFKNTLWALLSEKYEKIHFINRIDRETSGVVLIAKNAKIAEPCKANIQEKLYSVIVHGDCPENLSAEGFLYENLNISHQDTTKVRKKRFFSFKEPKEKFETAKTIFKKISFNNQYSYIEAKLFTGRLHQIRATLCSLGYPLVGDKIYGLDESFFLRFANGTLTENDKNALVLKRQALHASQMIIKHPKTQEIICLKADLPQCMKNLI